MAPTFYSYYCTVMNLKTLATSSRVEVSPLFIIAFIDIIIPHDMILKKKKSMDCALTTYSRRKYISQGKIS